MESSLYLMCCLPELHANIEVVKEVPSKRHAILRGENSMDPACRGRQSTEVYTMYTQTDIHNTLKEMTAK